MLLLLLLLLLIKIISNNLLFELNLWLSVLVLELIPKLGFSVLKIGGCFTSSYVFTMFVCVFTGVLFFEN